MTSNITPNLTPWDWGRINSEMLNKTPHFLLKIRFFPEKVSKFCLKRCFSVRERRHCICKNKFYSESKNRKFCKFKTKKYLFDNFQKSIWWRQTWPPTPQPSFIAVDGAIIVNILLVAFTTPFITNQKKKVQIKFAIFLEKIQCCNKKLWLPLKITKLPPPKGVGLLVMFGVIKYILRIIRCIFFGLLDRTHIFSENGEAESSIKNGDSI